MAKYPKEGQARKECYFTTKDDCVYALITELPDSGEFVIKDIELNEDSTVTMLGYDAALPVEITNGGIAVTLPNFNPSKMPCEHVYSLKITSVK